MHRLRNGVRWTFLRLSCALVFPVFVYSDAFAQSGFRDPLDNPAQTQSSPAGRPLMAIVNAGKGLVAVGSRGLIILSSDGGKSWSQASVPVQSDLLAVHFPTQRNGWAVGHDGVILASDDGGKSWRRQLDGRGAGKLFTDYYKQKNEAGDPAAASALAQINTNFKAGPTLPFLDVWFEDAHTGYAVGSFGMIIATHDGGNSWEPWLNHIENDQFLNLNAVRGINGEIYIAAERGLVFRLDRKSSTFKKVETGYAGSFFGITGSDSVLIAYGLRGVVYRSEDKGQSWVALKTPSEATITSGLRIEGSGQFALMNGSGQALISGPDARDFRPFSFKTPTRITGVVSQPDNTLLLSSTAGVKREAIPQSLQ